jgi:hypothetical protein
MLQHWNCNCKAYNDILTDYCWNCRKEKPDYITGNYQAIIEIKRGIFLNYGIYAISGINNMTPQEELFAKFYNQEKILVKDMDVTTLREHRDELSKIAFEAKARLVAADDETRERGSKTKNKEWLVTTDTSQSSTDAINAVQARAKRLSKMDKIQKDLLAAGIDEETVKEMVRNLERKATEKQVKTITFNKPTVEVTAVTVEVNKPSVSNGEVKEPFNPANLKFGS